MPKVAKTNYGIDWFKQKEAFGAGLPSITSQNEILAHVLDIKFPGEDPTDKGTGLQVKLAFDGFELKKKWFTLAESADTVLGTIGNADAVRASGAKILLKYPNNNIESGIAKLVCDNTQEEKFSEYQKNTTNNVVGAFSTLANNTRPPGYT